MFHIYKHICNPALSDKFSFQLLKAASRRLLTIETFLYSFSFTVFPLQFFPYSFSLTVFPLQFFPYSLSLTAFPLQLSPHNFPLYQIFPHGLIPQSLPAHDPHHVFTPCRRHAPGQAAAGGYLPRHRYQASRNILFAADRLHGNGLCRCMECYYQSQFFFPHMLHSGFPVPDGTGIYSMISLNPSPSCSTVTFLPWLIPYFLTFSFVWFSLTRTWIGPLPWVFRALAVRRTGSGQDKPLASTSYIIITSPFLYLFFPWHKPDCKQDCNA